MATLYDQIAEALAQGPVKVVHIGRDEYKSLLSECHGTHFASNALMAVPIHFHKDKKTLWLIER